MSKLLEVKGLQVSFQTAAGRVQAVRGIDLDIAPGETLAIVGESGCGKSAAMQSLMRLIPTPPAEVKADSILFAGKPLDITSDKEMEHIRGQEIAMIFQDPMTSLNPTITIGKQIMEGMIKHKKLSKADARAKAIKMLEKVGITSPEARMKQYPHQLSGGMRQRVMIAIALACEPKLLIADEPTTALDVTIQAQILDLMKELQEEFGTAIILITHDLGIVAGVADRTIVMYAGKVVEEGTVDDIFYKPQHPYTLGLLASLPRMDQDCGEELTPIPGSLPNMQAPPVGCPFVDRCQFAMKICVPEMPDKTIRSDTQYVRCWLQHPLADKEEAGDDNL